jgi:hypothetical protein
MTGGHLLEFMVGDMAASVGFWDWRMTPSAPF